MNDEARLLGRAKNAVLAFFESQLSIPKIYIDAEWDGHKVDVLAINRDGVGDVHVVRLFACRYLERGKLRPFDEIETEERLLSELAEIPAQFKYIGIVDSELKCEAFSVAPHIREKSFASDGMGRVGFLNIVIPEHAEVQVIPAIKPERFRARIARLADEYVQQHEADWEIRA